MEVELRSLKINNSNMFYFVSTLVKSIKNVFYIRDEKLKLKLLKRSMVQNQNLMILILMNKKIKL